ncbi:MAG: OmpA family protein [Myxococcaceae bacterium]|nr:OmpA family protein [Myxococcaceae bacterium]
MLGTPGGKDAPVRLVDSLTFFDVSAGFALKDRFEIAVGMPMSIATGQQATSLDPALGSALSGFAAGDLRVVPKYSFFSRDQAFQLAATLPISLPTGNRSALRGGGPVSASPRVIAELVTPFLRLVANLGFTFRTAEPRLLNLRVGQEFTFGVGGEVPLVGKENVLSLQFALTGAVGFANSGAAGAPVDAVGGLKYRLGNRLAFELGAGGGLSSGWGAPRWMIVGGFSYQHPPLSFPAAAPRDDATAPSQQSGKAEADAFAVARPPAATRLASPASEASTAPAEKAVAFLDTDGDGVADTDDKCPNEKETINGVKDTDGCADPGEGKVSFTAGKFQLRGKLEFFPRSAELTPATMSLLSQFALLLRANPDKRVRFDVFVTEMDTSKSNAVMSNERLTVLTRALMNEGVAASRIKGVAHGMERPLEPSNVEVSAF